MVFIDGADGQNLFGGNPSNHITNLQHIIVRYRSFDDWTAKNFAREKGRSDANNSGTHFRSNENKISDGYRERAPIEVEVF